MPNYHTTAKIEKSRGRIANQDSSGTAGVDEVELAGILIVCVLLHSLSVKFSNAVKAEIGPL